jgi:hypothetical protein
MIIDCCSRVTLTDDDAEGEDTGMGGGDGVSYMSLCYHVTSC